VKGKPSGGDASAPRTKKAKLIAAAQAASDEFSMAGAELLPQLAESLEAAADNLARIARAHFVKKIEILCNQIPQVGLKDGQQRDIDREWVDALKVSIRVNPFMPLGDIVIHVKMRKCPSTFKKTDSGISFFPLG
jgi:hypothetical protein